MTGFGWLILGIVAFSIFRAIAKGSAEAEAQRKIAPARPRPAARQARRTAPTPSPAHPTVAPAQALWQEVLGQLQEARRFPEAERTDRIGKATRSEWPEEWEETVSLEVEERSVSLEAEVGDRTPRVRVDHDALAEDIVRGRKESAASRDGAIGPADHRAFDEQIRKGEGAVAAPGGIAIADMRKAIVWRELLGPPVSMRGE